MDLEYWEYTGKEGKKFNTVSCTIQSTGAVFSQHPTITVGGKLSFTTSEEEKMYIYYEYEL